MKKSILFSIVLLHSFFLYSTEMIDIPSEENHTASNAMMEKELAHFQFDDLNLSKTSLFAGGGIDANTKFYVQLGSGEYVDLPFLARKMGNERLAKDLTWGRYYNTFKISFIVSLITGIALDIGGGILLYGYLGQLDGLDPTKDAPRASAPLFLNKTTLGWSIALFSLSTFSIAGIITFAISMAKGYRYNYGLAEGKAFVTQYNSYIRRKYSKLGFDLRTTVTGDMVLCMGFQF